MRTSFKFSLAAGLIAGLCALSGQASAKTFNITFATGHATHLPWIKAIKQYYIPEVDKRLKAAGGKHKIVWNQAFGGTVAKVRGVLEAVQEGVAEMGMVYTIFEPAKLPMLAVTFQAPFGTGDARLMSKIWVELHNEMPEVASQWHKNNQVFLGAVSADTDHIMTKFPVKTIDDLKGRKLGAAGGISLWVAGIGGVPVQGNFATHFNNVKTGVYDGLVAFTTGMFPIKMHKVAPYFTRADIGSMLIGAISINKKTYDSMPPEMRKILHDVGAIYSQKVAATMMAVAGKFEGIMAKQGTKFYSLPQSERKRWANTMPNLAKQWVARNEARGLPAKKVLAAYMNKLRANGATQLRDWDKE
jgi:TRAP-type C4-dicarboxylate transport system substrate-binding protein